MRPLSSKALVARSTIALVVASDTAALASVVFPGAD
jgi:hypothetical protein